MAAKLPGFRREAGSARGYISPEGDRLTYRQYRSELVKQGLVQPLQPTQLANARRKQRAFNDIINQMADVRRRALEHAAELAEELGDEEEAEDLREQMRTVKREAIRSPERKDALQTLKEAATHERTSGKGGRPRRIKDPEQEARVRQALEVLGRREGIPEWVPVGGSDKFRAGKMRKPRGGAGGQRARIRRK